MLLRWRRYPREFIAFKLKESSFLGKSLFRFKLIFLSSIRFLRKLSRLHFFPQSVKVLAHEILMALIKVVESISLDAFGRIEFIDIGRCNEIG